ncbi:MAG: hypothetical protein LBD67_04750 [Candidatus Accumulibacter sp.]|nr:hypothetical protein [Accumulibacter sp.]
MMRLSCIDYFVLDSGKVSCHSLQKLARLAEKACRERGTELRTLAGIDGTGGKKRRWKRGERDAAALHALETFHVFAFLCPADGNDLAALFDFYLEAAKRGLARETEDLILDALGVNTLAQIKRLSREAAGCSLFYGGAAAEIQG